MSDMHLGASYFSDSRSRELRVVRFLESITPTASEVYLLGDVLDYWYEYRYVVPRGFVRFFGQLARMSDAGIKITWITGNHDIWIFDYIPAELGVEIIDGILDREVMSTRMVMAHGDGIRQQDWKFSMLRRFFRNRFCQWLYSGIHPRWTVPFANAWSRQSRIKGERELNIREADRKIREITGAKLPDNITRLENFSENYLKCHPGCRYFLFGHLHQLVRRKISGGSELIVLGDWINEFSYAEYDGEQMLINHFRD